MDERVLPLGPGSLYSREEVEAINRWVDQVAPLVTQTDLEWLHEDNPPNDANFIIEEYQRRKRHREDLEAIIMEPIEKRFRRQVQFLGGVGVAAGLGFAGAFGAMRAAEDVEKAAEEAVDDVMEEVSADPTTVPEDLVDASSLDTGSNWKRLASALDDLEYPSRTRRALDGSVFDRRLMAFAAGRRELARAILRSALGTRRTGFRSRYTNRRYTRSPYRRRRYRFYTR